MAGCEVVIFFMSNNHHCCICLESIVDGGAVGSTNCGHCFHTECYKPWRTKSQRCPTCNATVTMFHPLYVDFAAILSVDDDDESIDTMEEENADEEMITENDPEKSGELSSPNGASKKRKRGDLQDDTSTIVVIDDEIAIVEKKQPEPVASKKLSKYKVFVKRQRATIASLQKHLDQFKEESEKDASKIDDLLEENKRLDDELATSRDEAVDLEQESHRQELTIHSMGRELQALKTHKTQLTLEIQQLKSQRRKESSSEMTEFKRYMAERPKLIAELKLLRENAATLGQRSQIQAGICKKQKRQMLKVLDKQCEQQKMSAPKRKQPLQLDKSKYANRSLQLMSNGLDQSKPTRSSNTTNPLSSLGKASKKSQSFAAKFLR